MMMLRFSTVALVVVALLGESGFAQQVRVAAAADLAPCTKELKQAFETANRGGSVTFSIGSSVQLAQQIDSGAPFDVFLSADLEQPQRLIASGKAERGSLFTYARGGLVILLPRANPQRIASVQDLVTSGVSRVAIADPSHAPYGKAAIAALRSAKLYERLQPKLVVGENVAQAAQFVLTGNADAGIVSATAHSAAAEQTVAVEMDSRLYPAIEQGAVLTRLGAENPTAAAFLGFMRSAEAKKILQAHGLKP